MVDTVLFHIDPLTGEDVRKESGDGDALKGHDAIAGPLVESYLLRNGPNKMVILLDEFVQVSDSSQIYMPRFLSLKS